MMLHKSRVTRTRGIPIARPGHLKAAFSARSARVSAYSICLRAGWRCRLARALGPHTPHSADPAPLPPSRARGGEGVGSFFISSTPTHGRRRPPVPNSTVSERSTRTSASQRYRLHLRARFFFLYYFVLHLRSYYC